MNSLLLKNVLHEGRRTNILVEGNRFACLDAPSDVQAEKVLEADGLAILPAFYNTHNHAAMVLLRGLGEDLPLQTWLQDYIWPYEDKMTPADIRKGSEEAISEMISSGTVFFSDMYFNIEETIEAVDKSGMRAAIGITFLDGHSLGQQEEKLDLLKHWKDPSGGRICLTLDPHAIYTAGPELFKKVFRLSEELGMKMHTHLAETSTEVDDCVKKHGMTPVRYLDSLGVLGPNVIAAHCVHIDKEEWDILAERGVTVAHCPCSNMKLGSGRFPYEMAISSGCRITLGTDGASSNNNLDMREEMKFAALLAKVSGDPTLLPATEVFKWATVNGAEAFGLDAGEIKEGKIADAVLLDSTKKRLQPDRNLLSNWVYSADSSCISAVLCDGKIITQNTL